MGIAELFFLAIGLAMDAFAVSVCKGLAMPRISLRRMALVGVWFGGFQAMMPVVGYFLGIRFARYITAVDHWIAFALLCFLGLSMIREGLSREQEEADPSLGIKIMFLLAVATSIDALAVGITFAFLSVRLAPAVGLIGVITFIFSCAGVKIGHVFGLRFKSKAELLGGAILLLMGVKILLEHLGVFSI